MSLLEIAATSSLPDLSSTAGTPAPTPASRLPDLSLTGGSSLPDLSSKGPQSQGPLAPVPEGGFSIGGFLGNVLGDVKDMAAGITGLVGMGVHDLAQLGKVIIPGEQPGESQGFQLDNLANAMLGTGEYAEAGSAIVNDYQNRYGSVGGFFKGLYEDPLSFVGDVLMAGSAVAKGAQLAGKAGLLSDAAVAAVRGPGSLDIMNPVGQLDPMAFKLSANPVARLAQTKIAKLGSMTPDDARLFAEGFLGTDLPLYQRASLAADTAEQMGIRVMHGTIGNAISKRQVSKAVSLLGLRRQDVANRAIAEATNILKQSDDYDMVRGLIHGEDAILGAPSAKSPNWRTPLEADPAIPNRLLPVTDISSDEALQAGHYEALRGLTRTYRSPSSPERPFGDIRVTELGRTDNPLLTPEDLVGVNGTRVTVFMGDMDNPAAVAAELQRAADAMGGELVGVQNDLANAVGYSSYRGSVRLQNGNIAEVNIATPDLYAAQTAWSNIQREANALKATVDAANAERAALFANSDEVVMPEGYEIGAKIPNEYPNHRGEMVPEPMTVLGPGRNPGEILVSTGPGIPARYSQLPEGAAWTMARQLAEGSPEAERAVELAETILKSEEELRAAEALRSTMFDATHRAMNATDANPYDVNLQAVDRLRALTYNNATQKEIAHGALTFRGAMDRAYGPQRSYRYAVMMANMQNALRDHFAQILEETGGKSGTQALSLRGAIEIMENALGPGHPGIEAAFRSLTDESFKFETLDNLKGILYTGEKTIPDNWWGKLDADYAANRVEQKVRDATYESIVLDGEHTGFSWQEMMRDSMDSNTPVPQYYPHIQASRITNADAISRGRAASVVAGETPRTRRWMGHLYETGRYELDPVKAYSTLFRQIANHQEFNSFMQGMVETFGRRISKEELAAWKASGSTGERLVSRTGMKQMVDLRGQLMFDTQQGLMQGKTMTQATIDALEALNDRILSNVDAVMMDDVWAIPKHIGDLLNREARLTLGTTFDFYYNGAQQMWKGAVLGLSPRWVVNNTFGNLIYMGIENPGAIRHALTQMSRPKRAYFQAAVPEAMTDDIARGFIHQERVAQDAATAARATRIGETAADWADRVKLSLVRRAAAATRRGVVKVRDKIFGINEHIEQAARRGVAIDAFAQQNLSAWDRTFTSSYKLIEDMARNGIADQAQWQRALREIDKTLGDYLVMSPLERNVIRKYIMPFYAFYRHTVKFMARMPFTHPLKSRVLTLIDQFDKEMEGERPDWLQGAAQVWESGGLPVFMRMQSANPLEAVSKAYGPSLLNPVLGMAIGRMTGTNPFGDPWVAPAGETVTTHSGKQYVVVRDGDGRFVGVRPIDGRWEPPLWQSMLSVVPQFALLPGVDVFGRDFAKKATSLAGVSLTSYDLNNYRLQQLRSQLEAYKSGAYAAAKYPA